MRWLRQFRPKTPAALFSARQPASVSRRFSTVVARRFRSLPDAARAQVVNQRSLLVFCLLRNSTILLEVPHAAAFFSTAARRASSRSRCNVSRRCSTASRAEPRDARLEALRGRGVAALGRLDEYADRGLDGGGVPKEDDSDARSVAAMAVAGRMQLSSSVSSETRRVLRVVRVFGRFAVRGRPSSVNNELVSSKPYPTAVFSASKAQRTLYCDLPLLSKTSLKPGGGAPGSTRSATASASARLIR
mmetsp:Transcript_12738/g.33688  ORF Transcript_12738/g.33688 Transcript_12738/m.33688 type:complete len:246 (-) Transcript_12738:189-926(-)